MHNLIKYATYVRSDPLPYALYWGSGKQFSLLSRIFSSQNNQLIGRQLNRLCIIIMVMQPHTLNFTHSKRHVHMGAAWGQISKLHVLNILIIIIVML